MTSTSPTTVSRQHNGATAPRSSSVLAVEVACSLTICGKKSIRTYVQPIVDGVAQNLEIVPKNFRFSTRRTRIFWDLSFITWY